MLAPNPANRLHCQHSPHRSLRITASSAQANLQGVNFGRRSPSSGGQNCTPKHTQYRQSVRRKETIRVAPLASRRTSILALTATLGLVLIITGGTLGYRWTQFHIGGEISEPSQQDRVPPPATSSRSPSTRPAPSEQHVVRITSQRSEADVLAVFRRLQQEQPTLFSQATLSRIDLGPQSYRARVGPFASEKDAAAACQALAAADIRCF